MNKKTSSMNENCRLRETDLRLKRPKQPAAPELMATTTSTGLKQSNSNSTVLSRSPSPAASIVAPVNYREMRQRGFRGTKYDAELVLASQGFGTWPSLPGDAWHHGRDVGKIWNNQSAGVDGFGGFFRHSSSNFSQPEATQVGR